MLATSDFVLNGNLTTIQSNLTLSNLQADHFKSYTCTAFDGFSSLSAMVILGSKLQYTVLNNFDVLHVTYIYYSL